MSFRSRSFSLITLAIAVAALSTFTFAQDSKPVTPAPDKEKTERSFHHGDHKGEWGNKAGRHEGMRGMGMMRMMHDLNLTEAQKTQIHSILEANKPDKANFEAMRPLMEAKRNGTITADQQAQLDQFRTASREKMRGVHEQIMNVLTAEQKAQLEAKKAEMKARREEFREKREQWKQQKQAAPSTTTEKPQVN